MKSCKTCVHFDGKSFCSDMGRTIYFDVSRFSCEFWVRNNEVASLKRENEELKMLLKEAMDEVEETLLLGISMQAYIEELELDNKVLKEALNKLADKKVTILYQQGRQQ